MTQSSKIWSGKCRRLVLFGVWLLVCAPREPARADSPGEPAAAGDAPHEADPGEAARLYDEGRRYFNVGEYDPAIEKLKAAYLIAPLPELLYDLGQAFRLKGDCAEALSLYRRYLATSPPASRAARTTARMADMQECVAAARSKTATATATATATTPAPAVTPGPPVAWPGGPTAITAAETRQAAPGSPPSARPRRRWALWTAVAAGAMAAVSGYYAWDAHVAADEVSAAFVPGRPWSDDDEAARRRGIFAERMAIGSGAAAAVTAGVAAWLMWR